MDNTADLLADRRRQRRKLQFWRAIAVIALIATVIGVVSAGDMWPGRDQIARFQFSGETLRCHLL